MNNTPSSSCIAEICVSYKPHATEMPTIKSSMDAHRVARCFYSEDTIALQEQFIIIYLNRQNKVLGVYPLSKGGITSTVADVRLIISVALKTAAVGVVISHNHPSGNLQPSTADKDLTQRIKQGCELLDIKLLDHLILTPDGNYLSFCDEEYL